MFKKISFLLLAFPLFFMFPGCSDDGGDDEAGPVTKLKVHVTYNGVKTIHAGGYIGVALNKSNELVNNNGYMLPDNTKMPYVGSQRDPVKGTPYVVTITSIPITEGYLFVYLNGDGADYKPVTGQSYIMYNNKSGAVGNEADLITLVEGEDNEVTVIFDDAYPYP